MLKFRYHSPNEHLYIHLLFGSLLRNFGWQQIYVVICEITPFSWCSIPKTKSQMGEFLEYLLIDLSGRKVPTRFVRCENASENVSNVKGLGQQYHFTCEFTALAPHRSMVWFNFRFLYLLLEWTLKLLLPTSTNPLSAPAYSAHLWAGAVLTANAVHNATLSWAPST